ncbi:hypothetical protein N7509_013821 [Penicillium cosmopolitanum]|uniref:Extracellular serine-rich protein n=1 Tax=Penicillium cosmopolitanum TaxID=1131564 RepID=A0A9W9SF96_9EURO|nr:uncharacterized protein N7509_013821 [Penicillium cosmopolitanum]KAJ5376935.1 hypothetical protein N7509_013821 [Penicillium cosmopolitanum]
MLFTRQFFWSAVASITVVGLGGAQSTPGTRTTTTDSTTSSTSTGKATHTIQVGPKTSPHAYVPHNITANVGDVVVFEFYPTNHSVVKADYDAPCVPADHGRFYSGIFNDFNTNDGSLVGPAPTWSVVINNTEPTFFYCTALDSCIKNGMVGVINPNSSQTFKTQYDKALDSPYMLVPGQSPPAEGSADSGSGSSSSSSNDSSGSGHGLSKGAIAGIAVAGVVFLGILVALFFLLGRNRVYKQWMSSQDGRTERTARWALFNHPNGGPEVASNAGKPPMTDTTSVSSPDPGRYNTMSPPLGDGNSSYGPSSPRHQSGHWSWDPSFNPRNARGPSELEANNVIHQLPESSNER